jgi:hypothetical protein
VGQSDPRSILPPLPQLFSLCATCFLFALRFRCTDDVIVSDHFKFLWYPFRQTSFVALTASRNCTPYFCSIIAFLLFSPNLCSRRSLIGRIDSFPSSAFQLPNLHGLLIQTTALGTTSTLNDTSDSWNSTSLTNLCVLFRFPSYCFLFALSDPSQVHPVSWSHCAATIIN